MKLNTVVFRELISMSKISHVSYRNYTRTYMFNSIPKGNFYIYSITRSNYNNIRYNIYFFQSLVYALITHVSFQFKLFVDLVLSDFPNNILRFLLNYNILSILYNSRLLIDIFSPSSSIVKTITSLFLCSSWYEREAWDLFGVFFLNNLDLRRILNDYGFDGHPLKKDFPLSGFNESYFLFLLGIVKYNSINMVQEFRFFNIISPWKVNISNV